MSKILKYDSEGNEVYFHHAVDAKEAVASGQFFDSNPKKKDELVKEEPKKNNKKKVKTQKKDQVIQPWSFSSLRSPLLALSCCKNKHLIDG